MNIRNRPPASKGGSITISRLGQRRQVVIPKEICEALGLAEGDFVELNSTKRAVVITPKKLVDADVVLTPEEEKHVRKGERELKHGKYVLWQDVKKKLKL